MELQKEDILKRLEWGVESSKIAEAQLSSVIRRTKKCLETAEKCLDRIRNLRNFTLQLGELPSPPNIGPADFFDPINDKIIKKK